MSDTQTPDNRNTPVSGLLTVFLCIRCNFKVLYDPNARVDGRCIIIIQVEFIF